MPSCMRGSTGFDSSRLEGSLCHSILCGGVDCFELIRAVNKFDIRPNALVVEVRDGFFTELCLVINSSREGEEDAN